MSGIYWLPVFYLANEYVSVPRRSKNNWFPISQPCVVGKRFTFLAEKIHITLLFTTNMKLKPADH